LLKLLDCGSGTCRVILVDGISAGYSGKKTGNITVRYIINIVMIFTLIYSFRMNIVTLLKN